MTDDLHDKPAFRIGAILAAALVLVGCGNPERRPAFSPSKKANELCADHGGVEAMDVLPTTWSWPRGVEATCKDGTTWKGYPNE